MMGPEDLVRCCCVCKLWRDLMNEYDEFLWKRFCFGFSLGSWKSVYLVQRYTKFVRAFDYRVEIAIIGAEGVGKNRLMQWLLRDDPKGCGYRFVNYDSKWYKILIYDTSEMHESIVLRYIDCSPILISVFDVSNRTSFAAQQHISFKDPSLNLGMRELFQTKHIYMIGNTRNAANREVTKEEAEALGGPMSYHELNIDKGSTEIEDLLLTILKTIPKSILQGKDEFPRLNVHLRSPPQLQRRTYCLIL
eukprot:TRINITY_DN9039_c0_g1_i1.p1 TRINITY_DN9039_c0_g1~~TRINITY_DN9039_c0_g1_i1.p1  ORF type:complete len:248 (-),score=31.26 TRINITY_DN9039_c0_g1_i1:52-795(-)